MPFIHVNRGLGLVKLYVRVYNTVIILAFDKTVKSIPEYDSSILQSDDKGDL